MGMTFNMFNGVEKFIEIQGFVLEASRTETTSKTYE